MGKTEILSALQLYYKLEKDIDFANKLGISSQVLYNWKKRNTYDAKLIYTKCLEINPEWLLTGNGEMLKENIKKEGLLVEKPIESRINYKDLADARLETIESLKRENELLRKDNSSFDTKIEEIYEVINGIMTIQIEGKIRDIMKKATSPEKVLK
jgi:Bacteriophage CI repressor helix-turn-helix domain